MHKSTYAFAIAALLALTFVCGSAQAQTNDKSLNAIAQRNGYNLQWLLPDRAVRLYRPGLVIVIRPGATMYEVNDRVEFADAAPSYVNGDLLITPSLASRLGRLAALAAAATNSAAQPRIAVNTGPVQPITLNVQPQKGSEALRVSGRAPSNAIVTITLLATFSRDLPTVVLSRNDLYAGPSGQFDARIPIAPDYTHNTIIQVLATAPGAELAQAVINVDAPNAGVNVPFDPKPCYGLQCPM